MFSSAASPLRAAGCASPPSRRPGSRAPPSLDAFGLVVAEQSRPSFSILGAGARAAGMGGAFTALADDASAASFNPAGLALLVRPEASLVLDGRRRTDAHAGFASLEDGEVELYDPSSTSFDTAGLNFASATWPVTASGRNLTFQLSYQRLIDFTFEGDRRFAERSADGAPLATLSQRIDQRGDVSTLSLAGAYQLTQRMSLGLTLSRWDGGWTFATRTREEHGDGSPEPELAYRQRNDWSGWNATGGILLRYRYLNVGASIRSGFSGDYRVDSAVDTNFETPFEPTSRFDGELRWPASYTVGVALKPTETWVVTTDYAEFDWDDMEVTGLPGGTVSFFDLKSEEETDARHAGIWRVGTEYTVFPGRSVVALRAGWFQEPRPVPRAPSDEKSAVRGGSLGLGWKRGPVSIDVAYQRTSSTLERLELVDPETVATGVVESQAVARVDVDEDRFFLSFLYQFDSRADVRRLFHFLFVGPNEREDGVDRADPSGEPPSWRSSSWPPPRRPRGGPGPGPRPEAAVLQWYQRYERGLAAAERGEWAAALEDFRAAGRDRRRPADRARTYGTRFLIDYDPAFQQARCLVALGRLDEAEPLLDEAEAAGVTDPEAVRALRGGGALGGHGGRRRPGTRARPRRRPPRGGTGAAAASEPAGGRNGSPPPTASTCPGRHRARSGSPATAYREIAPRHPCSPRRRGRRRRRSGPHRRRSRSPSGAGKTAIRWTTRRPPRSSRRRAIPTRGGEPGDREAWARGTTGGPPRRFRRTSPTGPASSSPTLALLAVLLVAGAAPTPSTAAAPPDAAAGSTPPPARSPGASAATGSSASWGAAAWRSPTGRSGSGTACRWRSRCPTRPAIPPTWSASSGKGGWGRPCTTPGSYASSRPERREGAPSWRWS